jgi:hypothetical protein
MTRRRQVTAGNAARAAAATLAVRAVLIGFVGLSLGSLLADADEGVAVILVYYALMFLLAIPAVLLTTTGLLVASGLIAVVFPVLSHVVRRYLPAPSLEDPSFGLVLDQPIGLVDELLLTGNYPVLAWMAYICLGIALGRLTLSSARTAMMILAIGLASASAAAVTSWVLLVPTGGAARIMEESALSSGETWQTLQLGPDGTTPTDSWWWLASAAPHSTTPLDVIHTMGAAAAVLGVMLLLDSLTRPGLRRAVEIGMAPLTAVGVMTLTLYTLHALYIGSEVAQGDSIPEYLVTVAIFLVGALLWRRTLGRGPLEKCVGLAAGWVADRASGRRHHEQRREDSP